MRTTLSIDDAILNGAKREAQRRGVSLGAVVEDALRRGLAARREPSPAPPIPAFTGDGVRPGVDLTSNRALRELLDDDRSLDQIR